MFQATHLHTCKGISELITQRPCFCRDWIGNVWAFTYWWPDLHSTSSPANETAPCMLLTVWSIFFQFSLMTYKLSGVTGHSLPIRVYSYVKDSQSNRCVWLSPFKKPPLVQDHWSLGQCIWLPPVIPPYQRPPISRNQSHVKDIQSTRNTPQSHIVQTSDPQPIACGQSIIVNFIFWVLSCPEDPLNVVGQSQ